MKSILFKKICLWAAHIYVVGPPILIFYWCKNLFWFSFYDIDIYHAILGDTVNKYQYNGKKIESS